MFQRYRTRLFTSTLLIFIAVLFSNAQELFPEASMLYEDSTVARVDISIHPDSLDIIINGDPNSDHEFPAIFKFTRGTETYQIEPIGFRLRGNTSRYSQKKSFKVSLNTFISGQKFYGVEKINLNGEHNDPSIARSKIVWDLFKKAGVPATRSSHVELYINGDYYGLYANIEHIDEEFLNLRYGNNDGNLYKCTWPADLSYISNNPDDYKFESSGRRAYELNRNEDIDDYSDLAHFINIINNTPVSDFPEILEPFFNINSYLKNYAIEVLTGHWDAYAFNKNNFYLYNNEETGKFEFIPYDGDNTFGIDWFNIDWATRNVYNWYNSDEDRPLVKRVLDNDSYRDRYSFYLNRFINDFFNSDSMDNYVHHLRDQLSPYAINDMYRTRDYGFTHEDFIRSYDWAIKDHVKDGITNYISSRSSTALSQIESVNISPIISLLGTNTPELYEEIIITALIEDESNPISTKLNYKVNNEFREIDMNNSPESSEIYYSTINPVYNPTILEYYIEATDEDFQISRDPQIGYHKLIIGSWPLNIEATEANINVSVYPNPFRNNIHIQFSDNILESIYTLHDISGRELKTGILNGNTILNFENSLHEKGLYILKISYTGISGAKYEQNLKLMYLGKDN